MPFNPNIHPVRRYHKKPLRRPWQCPPQPKICQIRDTQLDIILDVFDSKSKARHALWELCQDLPPRKSPTEPDRYIIELCKPAQEEKAP